MRATQRLSSFLAATLLALAGCHPAHHVDAGSPADSGATPDAGDDAGIVTDAGLDGGPLDSGNNDFDAGPDAGFCFNVECWNPVPSGTTQDLFGVWGSGASDIWAVGAAATVLHWNGTTWSSVSTATTADIHAIWGSSADNVWIGDSAGELVHWDGDAWSITSSGNPAINAIWGTDAQDVWAVGDNGTLLQWNGRMWSGEATNGMGGSFFGVWGTDLNDVWAVGSDSGGMAVAQHWNGLFWTSSTLPAAPPLRSVWGASTSDVWAVGGDAQGGAIMQWDGTSWSNMNADFSSEFALAGVWGIGESAMWAVGADVAAGGSGSVLIGNGVTWDYITSAPGQLNAIWGSQENDIWAVGNDGTIVAWTGLAPAGTATQLAFVQQPSTTSLGNDVEAYVAVEDATGTVVRGPAVTVQLAFSSNPSGGGLNGSTQPQEVQTVNGVAAFQNLAIETPGTYSLIATSPGLSSALSDSFTVEGPAALVFTLQPSTTLVNSPFATPLGVQVIDANGQLVPDANVRVQISLSGGSTAGRLVGGTISTAFGGLALFDGISVDAPGTDYTIVASTGGLTSATSNSFDILSGWSTAVSGVTTDLEAVWGSSASEIWAAGLGGVILSGDGSSWTTGSSGTTSDLLGLWGSSSDDVWAVGGDQTADTPTIIHWSDSEWSSVPVPSGDVLRGVWGSSANSVWAVGGDHATHSCTIMHWDGTAWSTITCPAGDQLNAISGTGPNDVWAVGDGGVILTWNGSTWTRSKPTTNNLTTVVGGDPPTIGDSSGNIWSWNGGTLAKQYTATSGILGSSRFTGDVWFVGDSGEALEQQVACGPIGDAGCGESLTPGLDVGTAANLTSVWIGGPTDVWVVGTGGTIVNWGGAGSPAGAPTQLVFLAEPSGATTAGHALPKIQVALADASGQTVTSASATIQMDFASDPTLGSLAGSLLQMTVNGIATFSALSIDEAANGYSLVATAGGYPIALSNSFDITPAAVAKLVFTQQPSYVAVGAAIAPAVTVYGADAFGNPAATLTAPVTISLLSNPGDATLGGTLTETPDGGAATFADLTVSATGNGYTLLATSGTLGQRSTVFDVSTWASVPSGTTEMLSAVWAVSPDTAWAVGSGGTILSWDGTSWQSVPSGTTATLNGVWASDPSNAWAVGEAPNSGAMTLLQWNGSTWINAVAPVAALLRGLDGDLTAVWGTSADNVYVVANLPDGNGEIVQWNGTSWAAVCCTAGSTPVAIGGSSASDIWAVGSDIEYWNGNAWLVLGNGASDFTGAWSAAPGAAWLLSGRDVATNSTQPMILTWNGTTWSVSWTSSSTTSLTGVWGADESDVWAVGTDGLVLYWSGTGPTWIKQTTPFTVSDGTVAAVGGSSATDVWLVGAGGIIAHGP